MLADLLPQQTLCYPWHRHFAEFTCWRCWARSGPFLTIATFLRMLPTKLDIPVTLLVTCRVTHSITLAL